VRTQPNTNRYGETIKTIAKLQAVLLILLAASSLLIGGSALHGALNITLVENIVHLFTGAWLAFAGYTLSEKPVSVSVAILSAMFLMLGISGLFASPGVANDYSWIHEVIRLVVGGLGVIGLAVGLLNRHKPA